MGPARPAHAINYTNTGATTLEVSRAGGGEAEGAIDPLRGESIRSIEATICTPFDENPKRYVLKLSPRTTIHLAIMVGNFLSLGIYLERLWERSQD